MIEVDFGDNAFQKLLDALKPGQRLSASAVLAALDSEEAMEDFCQLEQLPLDISDLPKAAGLGEAALRLRREEQLIKEGKLLSGLDEHDPLRLYLEELAAIPACGDVQLLAQELCEANRSGRGAQMLWQRLLNLSLSRVVEIAGEYTGYGVLLLDLIQEGSMGLWQYLPQFDGGDFEKQRDSVIHGVMKKAVLLQAHTDGVGMKMRQAMEDYRSVDERLLSDLGRNPTLAEIAQALHMTEETAASVADMIEAARLVNRVKAEPEADPQEEDQEVEGTAYFQMRQRINELLSVLSEEEAQLLTLRFGLDGKLPCSPQETGAKLGLTAEEVVKREAEALAKMRQI